MKPKPKPRSKPQSTSEDRLTALEDDMASVANAILSLKESLEANLGPLSMTPTLTGKAGCR